jgi:hypothetical protein
MDHGVVPGDERTPQHYVVGRVPPNGHRHGVHLEHVTPTLVNSVEPDFHDSFGGEISDTGGLEALLTQLPRLSNF